MASSLKNSQKFISMLLNKDIVDIKIPGGICYLTFVVDEFSGLFTSINFFYYTFKICIHNKWYIIRFLILIKSNILVFLEGIIMLEKFLFSHNFFCAILVSFLLRKNEDN